MWPGARRIRRAENDASVQVKILEDKNIGLANTISGLRAALDLKHANIQNCKAKIDRLEDRCECLSGEVSKALSRIANLEYQLKETAHEENALRESIIVHAKSLLTLANIDEKATVRICERTIVSHSSGCSPEVASLAEEQTRPLAKPIAENKDLQDEEQTGKNSNKTQETPASPQIRFTDASRSPSPLRLPSCEPASFGPH